MKEFVAYWVVTVTVSAVLGMVLFAIYGSLFIDHSTVNFFDWMGSGLMLSLFVSVPGYPFFRIMVGSFRVAIHKMKKH